MGDRFVHPALLAQSTGKVDVGVRVIRVDLQCLLILGYCFVHSFLLGKRAAEVVVGDIIA